MDTTAKDVQQQALCCTIEKVRETLLFCITSHHITSHRTVPTSKQHNTTQHNTTQQSKQLAFVGNRVIQT